MKRLVLFGVVLTLLCAVAGSAVSARTSQIAAVREAQRLLDAYHRPPGAIRLHAVPKGDHVPGSGGGGIFGNLVVRHRLWLVHLPVKAFQRYFFHRLSRWHAVAYGTLGGRTPHDVISTSVTYAARGFGGRATRRVLSVVAVKSHRPGWSLLRAGIVLVWHVSSAELEYLPAGVRTIDIRGPRGKTRVADQKQVRTIVRWFDHLPLDEAPFRAGSCGVEGGSQPVTFIFRGRHGTLASAIVPDHSGSCSAATYTIGGKDRTPLIAGDVARRVQTLLGVKLLR